MFELNKTSIDELITGFLSGGTTPEEEKQLLTWIESNDDNRMYYEQMYRAWMSSAQCGRLEPEREKQALKQIFRQLQPAKAQKNVFWINLFKYAAAIAFLIVGTYFVTRYFTTRQLESNLSGMTYEAHYGSRAYATLPDGSKVWLNSGSKVKILPGYYLQERRLELSGEAYFEVVTNPEKPFIVEAGGLTIKATGTIFNVKAYPEEEQITTTLMKGIVFIEGTANDGKAFKIRMNPDQSVSYKRQSANENTAAKKEADHSSLPPSGKQNFPQGLLSKSISPNETETLTSWMKNRWVIDNEKFGQLAVLLERRYNVEIRFESEELKKYRFTGKIERETVEQMFDVFRYSIPLKYTIDKGIITLTMDNELKKQYEKAWKQSVKDSI